MGAILVYGFCRSRLETQENEESLLPSIYSVADLQYYTFCLCIGNDRSDEEMYETTTEYYRTLEFVASRAKELEEITEETVRSDDIHLSNYQNSILFRDHRQFCLGLYHMISQCDA